MGIVRSATGRADVYSNRGVHTCARKKLSIARAAREPRRPACLRPAHRHRAASPPRAPSPSRSEPIAGAKGAPRAVAVRVPVSSEAERRFTARQTHTINLDIPRGFTLECSLAADMATNEPNLMGKGEGVVGQVGGHVVAVVEPRFLSTRSRSAVFSSSMARCRQRWRRRCHRRGVSEIFRLWGEMRELVAPRYLLP